MLGFEKNRDNEVTGPIVESPSDDELMATARRKGRAGKQAFELLVGRHQNWLVRLLVYLLGSKQESEDVAQNSFIRAYLALDRCVDGSRFQPWIRVIATRLAYNHIRDNKTRARYQGRYGESLPTTFEAEDSIITREILEKVLAKMSYPYREVLILRHVEELSVAELAEVLNIGISAAKMRLSRAREEFRKFYNQAACDIEEQTGSV